MGVYKLGLDINFRISDWMKAQAKYQRKEPQIQNVVSLAKLNQHEINLSTLAQKLSNSHYNPKRFPAVIFKKTEPKSTVLVFRSGKLIIIGSKSEQQANSVSRIAAKQIGKLLEKKKIKVEDFQVTNIVANASLGFQVDITGISEQPNFFKQQNFPGVIYKMQDPVKAVLIFSSGKMVFTGAKKIQNIKQAFIQIYERIEKKFKKENYQQAKSQTK